MQRSDFTEFLAFMGIVDNGSFARAAAQLGVTPSAVSQTIRKLEARLGVRLLNRTTRSVQLTDAGARLAEDLRLGFAQVEQAVLAASGYAGQVNGTVRLTASAVAAELLVHPHLGAFQRSHPGVSLDLSVNEQTVDLVGERLDAGLRRGDLLDADMVSHRLSPDVRMLTVASPGYLAVARLVQEPRDLKDHNCIRIRSIADGAVPPWRFTDGHSRVDVKVAGSITVDSTTVALAAALDGAGIAYLASDFLRNHLQSGRLVAMLGDWAITRPGFHFYYSGRRHVPEPVRVLAKFLKARSK